MNKFYEAANIISVFFFMPVLIFLAYNARSVTSEKNRGVVIESPQLPQLELPAEKPNLEVTPDNDSEAIVPEKPISSPTPKKPIRRPILPLIPRQPKAIEGNFCPSGGCGNAYYAPPGRVGCR